MFINILMLYIMDIHNIVKMQFTNNENFKHLPRAVRIAYTEIELYEKEKIKKMMEMKENENENERQKIYTPLQKKEDLKNTFIKIGGSSANSFAFNAYLGALYKCALNRSITTKDLYNNFSDENIFIYIYNHCVKYLTLTFNNVDLCNLLKLYLIDNNLQILEYIFLRGAKINTSDFNSKVRYLKHVIKINDEYYIFYDDKDNRHNNYNMITKKLIPKRNEAANKTLYHYSCASPERIAINISNQYYDTNKFVHIELFDDFFYTD